MCHSLYQQMEDSQETYNIHSLSLQETQAPKFSPWKKTILVALFFIITPLTIGASIFSLELISTNTQETEPVITKSIYEMPTYGAQVYASLPDPVGGVDAGPIKADGRVEMIRQYLEEYNSPISDKAEFIVSTSEKYGLDYRLLVAIAQQESNLCKKIPEGTYNCWGWGIHSQGTLAFRSYEEAIEAVAKGLKENYLDIGLTTPQEIMSKYTPLSNGSWAHGVELFLSQME